MSFTVIPRGNFVCAEPLKEGEVSIDTGGRITFLKRDLDLVGITDRAVILGDRENWRLAVRAPHPDEEMIALSVAQVMSGSKKNPRDSGRRRIGVARALSIIGLDGKGAAGRYNLLSKGEGRDALLIVALMDGAAPLGGKKAK